jgi:acetyltransferase-like isoleucine patch superfamily enzyme
MKRGIKMSKSLYFLYILASVISQIVGAILLAIALLPSYYLVFGIWKLTANMADNFWRVLIICLSIGFSYFIFGDALMIFIVIFKKFLRIKNQETNGNFRSLAVITVGVHNFLMNLIQFFYLPLVRSTPLIIWFYRGMGMKIGKDTIITTWRIFDCDMIEIGDHCVIGGSVAISAHIAEKGRGILKKVRIGNRVTIGANTTVLPGVTIEDNVIVGANSLIPKDARLETNSVYGGVPIRKIR